MIYIKFSGQLKLHICSILLTVILSLSLTKDVQAHSSSFTSNLPKCIIAFQDEGFTVNIETHSLQISSIINASAYNYEYVPHSPQIYANTRKNVNTNKTASTIPFSTVFMNLKIVLHEMGMTIKAG